MSRQPDFAHTPARTTRRRLRFRGTGSTTKRQSPLPGQHLLALLLLPLLGFLLPACAPNSDEGTLSGGDALRRATLTGDIASVPRSTLRAASFLVPHDPDGDYRISESVGIEGNDYLFTIETPHGGYVVRSVLSLVQTCYEIKVIEQHRRIEHGQEIMTGMGSYVTGTVRGAVNLVAHPIGSVKGIGRSVARFGRGVGRFVGKPFLDNPHVGDDINRTAPAYGFLYSTAIRRYAYELQVDAYSENPYLNALLRTVAREREAGRMGMMGATMLLPAGGQLGTVLDVASWGRRSTTPGGRNEPTEALIRDNGPEELKRILVRLYAESMELPYRRGSAVHELLNNVSFSPREQAYLRLYLSEIPAENREDAIRALARTNRTTQAVRLTAQMEMIHALHLGHRPVTHFIPTPDGLAILNDNGEWLLPVLWDHTHQRDAVLGLFTRAAASAKESGARRAELWFVGDVEPSLPSVAAQHGLQIRQQVAASPMFRFTTIRQLSYIRQPGDPTPQRGDR